jgi:hypothetical protein
MVSGERFPWWRKIFFVREIRNLHRQPEQPFPATILSLSTFPPEQKKIAESAFLIWETNSATYDRLTEYLKLI